MSRSSSRIAAVLFIAAALLVRGAGGAYCQILQEFYIAESPTAGILAHGGYFFRGSMGPDNSILFDVEVGFHDRLMAGISFGMQNLIGRGDVELNDLPGFKLRLRLLEETERRPALALGIDTQGEGRYFDDLERYERKSKGLYGILSKNYHLIRDFSLHGGANYTWEGQDETGVYIFGGFVFDFFTGFGVLLDYNISLDDDEFTKGYGYLDAGLKFDYRDNLRFKFLFKDLLGNYELENGVARFLEIFYISHF